MIRVMIFSFALSFASWADNCASLLPIFFKNFTESKLSDLGRYDFGSYAYNQASDVLKKQIDSWVDEVKDNPARYAVLQSHQQHLENLISTVDRYTDQLVRDGVNIERVKAAIYGHDLGKFIPADQRVRLHYAFKNFEGKDPEVLFKFLKEKGSMNKKQAEEFLEKLARDRKTRTLKSLFEMKEYRFLKESLMEDKDYINFFAEFLDHSQTSREWMRAHSFHGINNAGGPDNLTRQMMLDSVGHDGPPSLGSWWGQTYGAVTGMTYPRTRTVEGRVLQLVDRVDQAGAVIRGNILSGGPRKIGYQVKEQMKGGALVDYSINNVVNGTEDQIKYLQRSFGASIPGNLDQVIEKNIANYRRLRSATILYELDGGHAPASFDAIGEIKIDGISYYFSGLEDYYGTDKTMGAATLWWMKNVVKK